MALPNRIIIRLKKFFKYYKSKVNYLNKLSRYRKMPDEIILLVCCYLDQLGKCLYSKAGSSKYSFEQILLNHSGERDVFKMISVADLASDLFRMAEFSYILIERPGRIQIFSDEDKPLIKFIDQIDISLTGKIVYKFLISLCNSLKTDFRIYSHQTKNKECYAEMEAVLDSLHNNLYINKLSIKNKADILKALVKEYLFSCILYNNYRCKSVHEIAAINVDSHRFWTMKRPYFVELRSNWSTIGLFKLEFPSYFLISCIRTCIEYAEKAIIGKGLLPLSVWNSICDIGEFDYLDTESMEDTKRIRLKID